MKKLFLILFLATNIVVYSQELPTEPANGFAFPIGTKFTIKLHPTHSVSFNYSITELEPFSEVIDTWENDSLFNEKDQKGIIEFYCNYSSAIYLSRKHSKFLATDS
jgi:hypothetical protein